MRRSSLILLAGLLLLSGCGSDDEAGTPVACSSDGAAYLEALEDAPGEVLLQGETPLGDCIVEGQSAGDLSDVGGTLVAVATELNRLAVASGSEEATVQLGYLVGAVQEAASVTGGIHEDLVIRLDSAARFNQEPEPLGAEFERSFGQGYAAGQG